MFVFVENPRDTVGMILGEKIERKVRNVNKQNFVSEIQLLIKHVFLLLSFLYELLMSVTSNETDSLVFDLLLEK